MTKKIAYHTSAVLFALAAFLMLPTLAFAGGVDFTPSSDWANFLSAFMQYFNYAAAIAVIIGLLMLIYGMFLGGGGRWAKIGIGVVLAAAFGFLIAHGLLRMGNKCAADLLNNPSAASSSSAPCTPGS